MSDGLFPVPGMILSAALLFFPARELSAQIPLPVLEGTVIHGLDLKNADADEVVNLMRKAVETNGKYKKKVRFAVSKGTAFPRITLKKESISVLELLDELEASYAVSPTYFRRTNLLLLTHKKKMLLARAFPLKGKRRFSGAGAAKSFLMRGGVLFPKGASVLVDRKGNMLLVRNTYENLRKTGKMLGGEGIVPDWSERETLLENAPEEENGLADSASGASEKPVGTQTEKRMRRLLLPRVSFDGSTLEEAFGTLSKLVKEHDRNGPGMPVVLDVPDEWKKKRITVQLSNQPVLGVVRMLCRTFRLDFSFSPDGTLAVSAGKTRGGSSGASEAFAEKKEAELEKKH